jgi:signal transduction histidine kinase
MEMAMLSDIDLVITDQRMPEMSGLQLLARLREIRPRALRILLTAFPDTTVALKAINEGLVYRFVLKPWKPEEMRLTVRRALETKRLSDEHERLVTQLKSSHQELARSEHMAALGRISAGIGHELARTVQPMMAALADLEQELQRLVQLGKAAGKAMQTNFSVAEVAALKAELLRANPAMIGAAENALNEVRASAGQLENLAKSMKSYAQPSVLEPIDINQTVLSAVQLLSHRFRDEITLDRQLNAVPLVRCRSAEMTQVFLNLLGNAADAVEKRPAATVTVKTWHDGAKVKIEVTDNGRGLDPSIASRLFQPFTSTKDAARGGMGLSICRSIVESHGGTIVAESQRGAGAKFTVTLPAAAEQQIA